ncbi:MAG: MarR family winged helix-turn-helix transcriptional regulator [Candidatus Omnitrophica bacterium]|nr:MarR family winged helix-turn-helix transcriptional regulator [Candidatus Omnitrophota bacterium]
MATVDQIAHEISTLIPKLMRTVQTSSLLKLNISSAQIIILITIQAHGQCKTKIVAKERGISPPTATGLIDRLVRSGYVKRSPDPEDRRVVMVSLTKKGENMVKTHMDAIRDVWKKILVRLTAEEQKQYLHILKKISGATEPTSSTA